uniref:Uncharacterized protein n=1 Tax=Glossina austeni TaxID=7395 RepID=A0A1A9UP11_GLOAU
MTNGVRISGIEVKVQCNELRIQKFVDISCKTIVQPFTRRRRRNKVNTMLALALNMITIFGPAKTQMLEVHDFTNNNGTNQNRGTENNRTLQRNFSHDKCNT